MDLSKLAEEFPREAVSWRAQSLTKDKTKAQALAYIDARDVMDRLDAVCGPANWQSEFTETPKGRVLCRIGIRMDGGDWVWKSDGAGNTDVEGEKGAISDALKRAAVHWGVARYLYAMSSPWVPCEVTEQGKWRAWKGDPWDFVRSPSRSAASPSAPKAQPAPASPPLSKQAASPAKPRTAKQVADGMIAHLRTTPDAAALDAVWKDAAFLADYKRLRDKVPGEADRVDEAFDLHRGGLSDPIVLGEHRLEDNLPVAFQ